MLGKTYSINGIPYQGPIYKSIKNEDGKATITFDYTTNGLTSYYKPLVNFEIAGEDRVFYPASAFISGNSIVVQSDPVKSPVAVRYAFKDWLEGDLYNLADLPSAPFRTDSWY